MGLDADTSGKISCLAARIGLKERFFVDSQKTQENGEPLTSNLRWLRKIPPKPAAKNRSLRLFCAAAQAIFPETAKPSFQTVLMSFQQTTIGASRNL